MADKIQLRRGLSTFWTSTDPILADGEIGLETDTGRKKIGNGTDLWSVLPYDTGHGSVSITELGYLDGVTSAIQTQINSKQATITGAATTITSSNLTVSSALVSDASGKVAASSTVSATELGYLDGVTSAIQTQLDDKLPNTTSLTEINAALVDADEIPVYDASATGNRKSLLSRIWTYISGKLTATANTFTANQIISVADNTNAALRITQTGTGKCLVVEDSANPDATPFSVDANGNIAIGIDPTFANNKLSIAGDGANASSWLLRYSADITGYVLKFLKSRSTALYSNTTVQDGDTLGSLIFSGDNGSGYTDSAMISASVDGSPATNDMPGRLIFATTADGAATPIERLRINSSGNVGIGTTTISARAHIVATTEQLRLGYDATKFVTNTVDSAGNLTIDTTGGTIYTPDTMELTTAGAGIVLRSPDDTRYRITVANGGTLTVAAA